MVALSETRSKRVYRINPFVPGHTGPMGGVPGFALLDNYLIPSLLKIMHKINATRTHPDIFHLTVFENN